MNNWNPEDAKYCTAKSIHEVRYDEANVEVYDDEEPQMLALYLADGDKRWPARTVSLEDPAHAQRVLDAWGTKRTLVDKRLYKIVELRI